MGSDTFFNLCTEWKETLLDWVWSHVHKTDNSSTSFSRHCSMVWQSPYLLVHAILIISFITLSVTATGIRLDPKNGILDVPWCFMVSQGIVCVSVMYEE